MALFSRRSIQRALDRARTSGLTEAQARRLIGQLNSASRHVVPAEWEAVILGALAKYSKFQYEPDGDASADIVVQNSGTDGSISFVADITAPSDYGIEQRNPVSYLYEQIILLAIRIGVDSSKLGWHVGSRWDGDRADKRVEALLPPKSELSARLRSEIRPFLMQVRDNPGIASELVWSGARVDFRLVYDPVQRHSRFSGPLVMTVPYSKTRNAFYAALQRKAKAMSNMRHAATRGVLVCDGGCYGLQRASAGGLGAYSAVDIINAIFAKYPSLSFVTTSYYEFGLHYPSQRHALRHAIYFQSTVSETERTKLHAYFNEVFGEIPLPISSPNNAVRDVVARKEVPRGIALGAYHWIPRNLLKIPVRVFLSLVGDRLTKRDFKILFADTRPPSGGPIVAFFQDTVFSAKLLRAVYVEMKLEGDDDWIVFDSRPEPDPTNLSGTSTSHHCEINTENLIRYLAGLDYTMECGRPNRSSLAVLSPDVVQHIRRMLDEGRMLVGADMTTGGKTVNLYFGAPDAAISPYR